MDDYHHANTGLWKLDQRDGRFHFVLRNDTSHLQTLPKDIIL